MKMVVEVETAQQSNTTLKFHEIDQVFEREGNFTRFNILLHIWGFLVSICVCWNLVMTVFTGANPGWQCAKNYTNQFCITNANESFFVDDKSFNERCKLERNQWVYLANKTYSFVTEFDLICEKKTLAALISSSYYIGGIIGALFTGMIADNFGRKPLLIGALITCSLASFGGNFIKDIWQLFIMNIFAGVAQVGCFYTLLTYVLECVASKHRAISNGILQTGLVVSFFFIDMISFFNRDWRKIKLYSSFPSLLLFIISFAVPESPRWLLSKNRVEEAKFVLCQIIKFNQSNQSFNLLVKPREKDSKAYMELFRTLFLTTLTLSVAFVRFIVYAVYYILLFESPYLGGDLYQSFALALIPDLVSCVSYPLYADRVGRRKAQIGSLIMIGLLSCSISFIPYEYPNRYYINIALLLLAIFFGDIALVTINTWVFEIFPTSLRARGMSICIMSERIGIVVSPFVIRLFQGANHNISYYIVCGLCIAGVIVCYFVLPETRNTPTRESSEDFTGKIRNSSGFDNVAMEVEVITA